MINKQIKSHARMVKRSFSAEIFYNKEKALLFKRNIFMLVSAVGNIVSTDIRGALYMMKKRTETEDMRKAWQECLRTLSARQRKTFESIPSEATCDL